MLLVQDFTFSPVLQGAKWQLLYIREAKWRSWWLLFPGFLGVTTEIWPLPLIFHITHNFSVIALHRGRHDAQAGKCTPGTIIGCYLSFKLCGNKVYWGCFSAWWHIQFPFVLFLHIMLWCHCDCPLNHLCCLWKINSRRGKVHWLIYVCLLA